MHRAGADVPVPRAYAARDPTALMPLTRAPRRTPARVHVPVLVVFALEIVRSHRVGYRQHIAAIHVLMRDFAAAASARRR
jgi:hypothetical protein